MEDSPVGRVCFTCFKRYFDFENQQKPTPKDFVFPRCPYCTMNCLSDLMRVHPSFPENKEVCPDCYERFDEIAKQGNHKDEQTRKAHAQSETLGPMGKIAEGFYLGWNQ
jgi:hypothetical protein